MLTAEQIEKIKNTEWAKSLSKEPRKVQENVFCDFVPGYSEEIFDVIEAVTGVSVEDNPEFYLGDGECNLQWQIAEEIFGIKE